MSMRFRRSVKVAPGVKVNFNKKSVGMTVGGKGYHYSVNSSGRKTTSFGIPGTGVSFVNVSSKKRKQGGGSAQVDGVASRPASKGVYITMLVVAILWAIFSLAIIAIAPVIGVILLAVAALFAVIAVKGIKSHKAEKDGLPLHSSISNKEKHDVAGMSFHKEAIISLQRENENYQRSKEELIDLDLVTTFVWKYEFSPVKTELIPEPDNEADPNAIKVVVDGQHIGYIQKGAGAHIQKLLNSGSVKHIDAEIYGGPYKFIKETWDEDGNDAYMLSENTAPYYAIVKITKK